MAANLDKLRSVGGYSEYDLIMALTLPEDIGGEIYGKDFKGLKKLAGKMAKEGPNHCIHETK